MKHKGRKVHNSVLDEGFISCERKGIWPFTSGLQMVLNTSAIKVNIVAYLLKATTVEPEEEPLLSNTDTQ